MFCSSQSKKILIQLFLLCECALFGTSAFKRIVNGVDADENEFAFVVSLQRNGTHFCGGTTLDETHVLTAAHCVCNVNWDILNLLSVKLTPRDLDSPSAVSLPPQYVICNDYDVLELVKDVAVVKLSDRIPAAYFQPVRLPASDFSTAVPVYGRLVGWGLTSTKGTIANVLQKVDVVVYNDAICAKSYSGTRNIEHQICSGWPNNGRGSCQGDSGGPLLVGDVQIGVISFGDDTDCAVSDLNKPKISARVSAYLEWINDAIKIDEVSTEEQSTTEEEAIVTTVEANTENTENINETELDNNGEDQHLGITPEGIRDNSNSSHRAENDILTYFIFLYVARYILY